MFCETSADNVQTLNCKLHQKSETTFETFFSGSRGSKSALSMWWVPGEISQVREKFCPEYVAFTTYIRNLVENIFTSCYFFENKNISAFAVSVFIFGELHQKRSSSLHSFSLQRLPLPVQGPWKSGSDDKGQSVLMHKRSAILSRKCLVNTGNK